MGTISSGSEGPTESGPLDPSKLGTFAHWNEVYAREVQNWKDFGDEGEIWFGEATAIQMVVWALKHVNKASRILDLGCGNGHLCFMMGDEGFLHVSGIDYSEASVELASEIAKKKPRHTVPHFYKANIFNVDELMSRGEWDLVLDKGTFDAISLSDETIDGLPISMHYPRVIAELLQPGGLFLITSCNWTKTELSKAFVGSGHDHFRYHSEIPRPSFSFGGSTGQSITTVAFQKLA